MRSQGVTAVGDIDTDALSRAWRERAAEQRREADLLRQDALRKAGQAASFIKSNYGAAKVYLYGSLAWSRSFGPHSDIDLLVEGLERPDAYWRMLSELWAITAPFPPSVVLAEDAQVSLLGQGSREGSGVAMTQGDYEVLQGRIREELDNVRRLEDELVRGGVLLEDARQAVPSLAASDSMALRSIGSILHDFYSAAENVFKVIARDIDDSLPSHMDWHRSLLTQMSMPLNTRRPRVLRGETVDALDEFRSFRHVFRNVYGFALDPDRLHLLLRRFRRAVDMLENDLHEFMGAIEHIIPED